MAGRFVFQQLASGMSRSTSRLVGARASAASRAAAPAMPCAYSEDGVSTISKLFHAAAAAVRPAGSVLPSISSHGGVRGYRTAYTPPCLPPGRVPAKIRRLKAKTMSPTSINNHNKSALVDSVGQVKPTCSPDASNQLKPVKVPWYNRPVDLKLHQLNMFQFTVPGFLLGYAAGAMVFSEDINNSSSIPSQSLHCSCCNCRNRR